MRLYNTLSRQEEEFAPSCDNTVRMYTCGLTVYARGHIGNFRTFVCLDVLRRTLKYVAGYAVKQVVNFTDVDDKTIKASRTAGITLRDYTDTYVDAFREDAAALGIESVEEYPRATDEQNLRAMADMVKSLDARGHTYRSGGSIYFRIDTKSDYGKLARLDHDGIKPGARIDADQYEKHDARDFVLWKATTGDEPAWDYGVGAGRPGWHIECSAMALRLLGEPPIDVHAGGVDLIFPHHENEIAQAEGATGIQFARFWVHVEHLLLDQGDKMSKSIGNVLGVRDVLDRGYRGSTLRYVLMSTHYRKQLHFTWDSLAQAEEALMRLTNFLGRLDLVTAPGHHAAIEERVGQAREAFRMKMLSDLNTPGALGALFELVREVNAAIDAGDVGTDDVATVHVVFDEFDKVLGLIGLRRLEDAAAPVAVEEIDRLIEERNAARRRRDFSVADRIRVDLDTRGIVLEDGPAGTHWKRKSTRSV